MNSKSLTLVSGLFSLFTAAVLAAPPNTITMDGRPLEYDATELVGFSTNQSNSFGPGNVITNLFVTWDSEYVYFALQGKEVNDKLTIMVDVDPGNGTGASTTTNWPGSSLDRPDFIRYNGPGWIAADGGPAFGLDYQIASEGFFNNIIRVRYNGIEIPGTNNVDSLFDSGNGATPQGGQADMVILADASECPLKGIEARIAWSVLFTNNLFGTVEESQVVPQGATLRVFAVLHNNNPDIAFSSDGIIPPQVSGLANFAGGIWTTADYIDVVIDGDNDGLPDLGVGDVNAPYLKYVSGVQGKQEIFAWFNEDVVLETATNTLNWLVDGVNPTAITMVQSDAVLLTVSSPLPAAGTLVEVQASGVEDASSNFKTANFCLDPSASGIETSIVVRFLLNINSGFGASAANPRATNFFVNGGAAPLEFGFPPAKTSPLTALSTTQHYRDVTFPPGTAAKIFYKYSGELTQGGLATGTNNYEAIRLANFADVARELTFPTNGITSLVVTDWLGAAAAPFRNPGTNSGYNGLYIDVRRGDAGVRQRTTMLFQLDLSQRNLQGVTRVLVQGTDPLRGFNTDNTGISDFAGSGAVGWEVGGVELFDNGTNGDLVAGDFIFSRRWSGTTNGLDSLIVSGSPASLAGGDFDQPPFLGDWLTQRTPKSFKYKFYVYKAGTSQSFESPASDIEYFIEGSPTNIVFEPFVWANNELPLPPPSNSPTMAAITTTGSVYQATFSNQVTELQHGVEISTNLVQGWLDYGTRAVTTAVAGVWRANVGNPTPVEHYRAFAGPPKPFAGVWMEPYPIPATGATVRVYYTQHSRMLTGDRNVQLAGNWTSWNPVPMTFLGDGVWYYDLVANTSVFANTEIKFKPRSFPAVGTLWDGMGGGGNDFFFYVGDLRATYSNTSPTNGELFTITYNANGGPLAASTNVRAYVGFDEQWNGAANRQMTNTAGNTNIWELSFAIPTNTALSINFVFNGTIGAGTTWDSEGSAPPNGRQWRIFIDKPE
jgi:hypothetical protein